MAILYISMIVSLGAMGVGYAAWNDGLSVDMNLTTGYLEAKITVDNNHRALEYNVVNEDKTLSIEGTINPGHSENVSIEIYDDIGSIPMQYVDIEDNIKSEIENLQKENDNKFSLSIEIEDIDINKNEGYEILSYNTIDNNNVNDELHLEVNSLINEINALEDQIESLNFEPKDYKFEYIIKYKQGI